MADVKISGLPASTTPLAGSEVLPVVQGGITKKISVDNLTAGKSVSATQFNSTIATGTAPLVVASTTEVANLRAANATSADTANQVKSNATTGVLQVAGPAAASTRVMTTPDANFTVARTDAGQTFTGTQTFSTPVAVSSGGTGASTFTTGRVLFGAGTSAINTSENFFFDSSGNLIIGTTATANSARLRVLGGSTSGANYTLLVEGSGGADNFYVRDDGEMYSLPTYNRASGNASNVGIDAAGGFFRSTSSLKYKTDIQDAKHGLAEVLKLRSVTYKGKNDGDTVFGGLIAEEVDAIGLNEFVQYAKDGTPDAISYANMVSLLAKAIQELKNELDIAVNEIEKLKLSK